MKLEAKKLFYGFFGICAAIAIAIGFYALLSGAGYLIYLSSWVMIKMGWYFLLVPAAVLAMALIAGWISNKRGKKP